MNYKSQQLLLLADGVNVKNINYVGSDDCKGERERGEGGRGP